jgi:hypothetical protein
MWAVNVRTGSLLVVVALATACSGGNDTQATASHPAAGSSSTATLAAPCPTNQLTNAPQPDQVVVSTTAAVGIVAIHADPYPEGPPVDVEESSPPPLRAAFDRGQRMIPLPLPTPLPQGCCPSGAIVYVSVSDGQTATYGPCDRPAVIDAVTRILIDAQGAGPPATT